jgi:hypothetical protein
MEDLVVEREDPFSSIVITALREGLTRREGTPQMMARAVRAVLDVERNMSAGGAYNLVNRLWVR